MATLDEIEGVLARARSVAVEYYKITGKPLGITGEIGEYEAARLLNLTLSSARKAGFDAVDAAGRKLQIKARSIKGARAGRSQRVGSVSLNHQWDAVLLVLLDEHFMPTAIYEADRAAIEVALLAPGSRARNERGALSVSKFTGIGRPVWPT